MRAFIAITLPSNIRDYLKQAQNNLLETGADVKYVEPQNLHLTLKFLGEINDAQKEAIIGIMDRVAADNLCFNSRINALGAFPKLEYPRVIWAGLDDENNYFKKIVQTLEEKIEKLGIPKENRKFSAHITLGRVRSGKNRLELVKKLTDLQKMLVSEEAQTKLTMEIGKLTLFKSTLSPRGATYECIQEIPLKK